MRRKIHDLRNEDSEFELTVGDIQLPTIYDIRRAIGGANGPNAANYNDNSQTNVHIHVNGGEPDRVYREVDRAVRGRNRSARRSAGHVPVR